MKSEDAAKTSHYTGPINVMTVREVSAYLRVHPATIYRLMKRNQIPAFHVGSDWRFNIEAIETGACSNRSGRQKRAISRLLVCVSPRRDAQLPRARMPGCSEGVVSRIAAVADSAGGSRRNSYLCSARASPLSRQRCSSPDTASS